MKVLAKFCRKAQQRRFWEISQFLVASSKTGARLYKHSCPSVCVCVCVCMYVSMCVCDSATAQTDGWILMKFSTNDLTDICEARFSRILKIRYR